MPKQNIGSLEQCLRKTLGHCDSSNYHLLIEALDYRFNLVQSNLMNAQKQAELIKAKLAESGNKPLIEEFEGVVHAMSLALWVLRNPEDFLRYPNADKIHQILYARGDMAVAYERLRGFTDKARKAELPEVVEELERPCIEFGHEIG